MRLLCLLPFLLLVFNGLVSSEDDSCEEGWKQIGDNCYYFDIRNKTTVFGARSICATLKARLPIFESVPEYKLFNESVIKIYQNLSIGLGLELLGGQWTRMCDGRTTYNIYWQTGVQAPHDDLIQRCVVRMDDAWKQAHCTQTYGVTPVCQVAIKSFNVSEVACAVVYRFGNGYQHLLTTNVADAGDRGFILNQTTQLGGPLYVATVYIPGVTLPLYEVQNPANVYDVALVNNDTDLWTLVNYYGFNVRSIVGYTLTTPDFGGSTLRHLSWSKEVPGDTVVSDEEEYTKYMLHWNWKPKPPLYFFDKTLGSGKCLLERNCTLSEWSPWTNCSASCGNGTRIRTRQIELPAVGHGWCPPTEDEESCDLEPCQTIQYIGMLSPEVVNALENNGILDTISDQQSLVASVTNAVIPSVFAAYEGDTHAAGHQLNDTVEFCMYDDQSCDKDTLFKPRLNPFYGNCFTFNPRENELNVTRSGPEGGLRLLLRLQQQEYYPCTQTAGFKIYMHPHNEYPFVETYGYSIAPGLLTSMAISMGKLQKKDTPQNPCTDTWDNPAHPGISYYYNGTYNPEGCTKSCLQDYIIKQCHCADPRYARPNNVSFCSDDNSNDERKKFANYTSVKTLCPDYYQNTSCVKTYLTDADCRCISQCERVYFDTVINTASLLPNRHMEEVACEETDFAQGCAAKAVYHFALLEIYYERLQSVTFHEEEKTTIWDLLQDISNMIQNINGFDFFAIFEFGFLIAEIINLTCFGKTKKRNMRQSRVPLVRLLADDTTMTDFLFFLFTFCGSLLLVAFLYSSKVLEIRW